MRKRTGISTFLFLMTSHAVKKGSEGHFVRLVRSLAYNIPRVEMGVDARNRNFLPSRPVNNDQKEMRKEGRDCDNCSGLERVAFPIPLSSPCSWMHILLECPRDVRKENENKPAV